MPQIPLTLRLVKGSKLTFSELDNNFIRLRDAINSKTDFYVTGGIYNPSTMSLDFTGNKGFTPFNVDVSSLTDTYVSGGVYDPNTGCVTFSTTSGYTFDVCGFVTGNTLEQVLVNGNDTGANWIETENNYGIRGNYYGLDNSDYIQFNDGSVRISSSDFTYGSYIETSPDRIVMFSDNEFLVTGNGLYEGIKYTSDYSSNFVNRSLVDKEYVDREISGNTYWTSGSSGNYSIKVINDTTTDATGDYAVAEGRNTLASGSYSHAEGIDTIASGYASHAEGEETIASGASSHAEGYLTTTIGDGSHAEGQESKSYGQASHAEGYRSRSYGNFSHAEGKYTTASGDTSHAEGKHTTASGMASHAEGWLTIASGDHSHAEGTSTIASGYTSHAEGGNTIASGNYSHTEGLGSVASGDYSHAGGVSSTASGDTSFIHSTNSLVTGDRSVVLGGQNNEISILSNDSSILGGTGNTIQFSVRSGIFNGLSNTLNGGGGDNLVYNSNILGGEGNTISNAQSNSSIIGGSDNTIDGYYSGGNIRGKDNGILGGVGNTIDVGVDRNAIIAGTNNLIGAETGTMNSVIAGGKDNTIFFSVGRGDGSFIGGGHSNTISGYAGNKPIISSIIGGSGNTIGGLSNVHIIGCKDVTGTTDDTVYVPYLNINNLSTGTSINNLGIDSNGNVVPSITDNITITRAEGLTLVSNSGLTPTADYYISDSKIWIKAIDSHNFSRNAIKSQQIVKSTAYTGTGCLGVWTSSLTPIIGDKVIWGGRLWSNLTGNVGSSVDYTSLDTTNWSLLTSDSLYEDKLFFIIYDFVNNNISSQYDDRNNVIMPKADYITDGYLYTDWGDTRISNNICTIITNNIPLGLIVNNECLKEGITGNIDVDIYDNECGTIRNNSGGGEIVDNIVLNAIENNVVTNFIGNNYSYYITNNQVNSCQGNKVADIFNNIVSTIYSNDGGQILSNNIPSGKRISNNYNFSVIDNNTNNGDIVGNDCINIRNNTNNGDITFNKCISIANNSNNGNITVNDVSDTIDVNSNDGYIYNNRCWRIYNNSNVGNIESNVTQSIELNTYNGDCSFNLADGNTDNLTIDSIGSMIFGGTGNTINNKTNVQVFSRYDFSPTDDNKTYVESLNINTLGIGTSVNSLGVDVDGNVVIGTSGSTSVDTFTTGGTYDNSTALLSFTKNDSTTYDVDMSDLPLTDDLTIEVDGNNEIRLKDFVGSPTGGTRTFDGQIVITSGLTLSTLGTGTSINNLGIDSNGNVVVGTSGSTFTGNTSGDCISDLYVSNIHSCSPLNINPNNEGNVTIGQNSLIVDTTNDRIGIGKSSPTVSLDVVGDTKVSGNITTEGNLTVQGTSSTINGVNRTTYTFQTVGATTYTVGDPLQQVNTSRYLKAIVVGQSTSPQNSTTAGSCGGEFINFYDAGTTFDFPNPPEQYSNLLSSTGTLSNNILDGNPQFALTLKGFTATGIANTTINWKVILEVGSL